MFHQELGNCIPGPPMPLRTLESTKRLPRRAKRSPRGFQILPNRYDILSKFILGHHPDPRPPRSLHRVPKRLRSGSKGTFRKPPEAPRWSQTGPQQPPQRCPKKPQTASRSFISWCVFCIKAWKALKSCPGPQVTKPLWTVIVSKVHQLSLFHAVSGFCLLVRCFPVRACSHLVCSIFKVRITDHKHNPLRLNGSKPLSRKESRRGSAKAHTLTPRIMFDTTKDSTPIGMNIM